MAAMLVAVAGVIAACGSSGNAGSSGQEQGTSEETTSSPVEAVQVAYKTTTEQKTAKVDTNVTVSGLPARTTPSGKATPTSIDITSQGVVDFANQAADLTVQMPQFGDLETRQIGTTVYEKLPERLAQASGQKPWVKLDLDTIAQEQLGASFSQLQGGNASTNDPAQQLSYLQGVSDSVQEVGTEEVRGAPATHYSATVDLEKAAAQQEGTQARQAYDKLEQQLGTSTLPMDVWLDEQGRVVRLQTNVPVTNPAGSGDSQGQVAVTEEFYDFGTPVSVEPPPDDQTAEMTDLTSAQKPSKAR